MQTWTRKTVVGGLLAAGCLAFGLAAAPAGAIPLAGEPVTAGGLNSVVDLPAVSDPAPLGKTGGSSSGSTGVVNVPVTLSCNAAGVLGAAAVKCVEAKKGGSAGSSKGVVNVPVTVSCNAAGVLGVAAVKCGEAKKNGYGSENSNPGSASGSGSVSGSGSGSGSTSTPVKAAFASQLPTTGADLGMLAALGLTLFTAGLLLLRRAPRRVRHSATHRL